jgi:hypothetical protein
MRSWQRFPPQLSAPAPPDSPIARFVRRAGALVAIGVAVAVLLSGCGLVGTSAKPEPTKTAAAALSALVPTYPTNYTAATAKAGTVKTADAIQALIASTEIVHVDDNSKLVAATSSAAAFYGVERAVTTKTGFDAIAQATAMEKLLVAAGWIERQTNTSTTAYTVQLTVATTQGVSALFIQADTTAGESPVILIELESPDLPKS